MYPHSTHKRTGPYNRPYVGLCEKMYAYVVCNLDYSIFDYVR